MNKIFLRCSVALLAAVIALSAAATAVAQQTKTETVIFAGGCFWCVESDFDKIPGVVTTVSGYSGGHTDNPTYRQVTAGGTGHREVVQITFDPSVVAFSDLMTAFWHSVDPTDFGGQFCDRGESYSTAVYVNSAEQRRIAETSKAAAEKDLGQPIVTPVLDAGPFYDAEGYHQDYYKNNPVRYNAYRWSCGRDKRVKALWGDAAHKGIPGHG